MNIRTLIVDDEPLARERLSQLLAGQNDIEVIGECGDGKSAVRAIRNTSPDLVLLDIQLPEMDGFEIVESIEGRRVPAIIFVTAYDQYALRAFKIHAVDYLLKPVDGGSLSNALNHFRERMHSVPEEIQERLRDLLRDLEVQRKRGTRFVLKSNEDILCLKLGEIDWIESAGNYVCVHAGPATHISRETMNEVEQTLGPHNFVRIHRSTIVNLDRIRRLKPLLYGDYAVELRDGTKLNMSRVYRPAVLKKISGI